MIRPSEYRDLGELKQEICPQDIDAAAQAATKLNVPFVMLTTFKGTRLFVEAAPAKATEELPHR